MSAGQVAVGGVSGEAIAAMPEAPGFLRRLLRRPLAVACLVYLGLVVVVAIVAPIALPNVSSEHAGDLLAVHQGPSWHHPLGTDSLGRDMLQRLLVGTRVAMLGVAEALVTGLVLGVPLGLIAGFLGGWIDRTVGWLADLAFSTPAVVIVIIVLSVFPQSMLAAMITLGALAAPGLMRVVRSATLPVREELYIAAAQVSGLSRRYIVSRHVLPRVVGPVIVQASLLAGVALLVQAGLAFLSLVVAAPAPSWGGMIADGSQVIELQGWLIWPPEIAIGLTILALGLLGDAVRDTASESWSSALRPRKASPRAVPQALATPSGPRPLDDGSAPREAPLLSIEDLDVVLEREAGPVDVATDVTFDVMEGETVGIVGESGCGKTITAMAVLGLLPAVARIDGGRIVFDGQDLTAASEAKLRRIRGKEIGLISQEPMISLDPTFRVGAQLAEAVRRHHGVSRKAARGRALELLDRVQLPDPALVAMRYPHELSGGMAQRVAIARALAGDPKLLIADEPTTALDVTVQAEILDLLRELQTERGMAILLITHDWGVVADLCERVVVMYAGQVVERAPLNEIFRTPLHPYTEALLASDPHNVTDAEMLPTIPGTVPQPGSWPQGCRFEPRCAHATAACKLAPIALEEPLAERQTRCIRHSILLPR